MHSRLLIATILLLSLFAQAPRTAAARTPGADDPRGLCESDQPICLLDAGIDPVVSLRWQAFQGPPKHGRRTFHRHPGRWRDIADGHLAVIRDDVRLLAENRTDRAVRIHITLQPWGLRQRADLPEFDLAIGPRESVPLAIDPETLGFDLERRRSLVGLRAVVRSYAEVGRSSTASSRLDQVISPMLYLQKRNPRSPVMFAFDESRLDQLVNPPGQQPFGNPLCTLTTPPDGGNDDEDLQLTIDPGTGDPEPGQVFTVDPPADGNLTFCFALPVDTKDSGIGEDFGVLPTTNYPASHAQVKITSLPPQSAVVVNDEFLDADGCVTFPHTSAPGYSVKLIGRANVPSSSDSSEANLIEVRTDENHVPAWYWCSDQDLEAPAVKWFYANPNRRTNLLGLSIFTMVRFSDGIGGNTIVVYDQPCSTSPTNSCNTIGGHVQVNPDHNQYRYAVSHEIGHAVVHRFLGTGHPVLCGSYAVNAGGAACEWELSHALQSKEFSSAAMTEGFAQFYATAVYNRLDQTNAWFHYYKDDYKNGTVKIVDMEGDSAGGATAYLDNICEGPDEGFGVELDWARQFWDYMTNAGLKPTRLQLLQQLKLAYDSDDISPEWNNGNSTERMNQAVQTHANGDYAQRWLDLAEPNGVDPATFNEQCGWFCFPQCTTACTEDSCNCSACDP